jgi:hypothetical protein
MMFEEFRQRENMASWSLTALYLVEQRSRAMVTGNRSIVIAISPQPDRMVKVIRYIRRKIGVLVLSMQEYGFKFRVEYLPQEGEHIGPFIRFVRKQFPTGIEVTTMTAQDSERLEELEWWCDCEA